MKTEKLYTAFFFFALAMCAKAQVSPIKWQNSINTDTGRVIYEASGYFDQILAPNTDLYDIKPLAGGGYMAIVNGRGPLLVKISAIGDTLFTKKLTDHSFKLVATADGGVVVLGYNSNSRHGVSGTTLCKYNSQGVRIWREEYKGGNAISPTYAREEPADLLPTPDGGYMILASSNLLKGNDKSQDPIGPVSAGIAPDYWVIKTDANGLPEWDKTIGGNTTDIGTSLVTAADGGYIIAGYSNSPVSGNKTQPQKGIDHQNPSDIWLVKIDNVGNVLWDKTVGTTLNDFNPMMITTKDGGFLLNCTTYGGADGDKTEPSFGSDDSWVIKFDGKANIQWQKTLGGTYQEAASSLMELPNGGYLLSYTSSSPKSGNKTVESFSARESDIWQVKLSATGTLEWQAAFGGTQSERTPITILLADGTMLMASSSNSDISGNKTVATKSRFMFEGTEYTGGNDVWLVMFDVPSLPVSLLSFTGHAKDGHALLQWKTTTEENFSHFELEKSFNGQVFVAISTVAAKGSGNTYNHTDNDFNAGSATINHISYYRLKMVDKDGSAKYSNIVAINTGSNTTATIAPNPVSGNQILVMSMAAAPKDAAWQIVGADGRIYASQKITRGTTQVKINTKMLAKGTYMLVYGQATDVNVLRFVKN